MTAQLSLSTRSPSPQGEPACVSQGWGPGSHLGRLKQEGGANAPVVVHQHVNHILEAVWLLGGKEATTDLVHSLPQLGQALIVLLGDVPAEMGCSVPGAPRQAASGQALAAPEPPVPCEGAAGCAPLLGLKGVQA